MVEDIVAEAAEAADWLGEKTLDPRVLEALERVPRHAFVPMMEAPAAYRNRPLPIGHRQTISQPFIVAVMSDQAAVKPGSKVLEVGTGSGYQAAVLAELGAEVFTIEVVPELAEQAAADLAAAGYGRVRCRQGDGAAGWPEEAPFDAILVTAAAETTPEALIEQLAPGGCLIIPVDAEPRARITLHWLRPEQFLIRLDKAADGSVSRRTLLPVAFVPLTSSKDPGRLTIFRSLRGSARTCIRVPKSRFWRLCRFSRRPRKRPGSRPFWGRPTPARPTWPSTACWAIPAA